VKIHAPVLPAVNNLHLSKNLRAYPCVECGSQELQDTYNIRVNVEKSFNHFKDSLCIANLNTQNEKTLHADLLLAGITQLVSVLIADKINSSVTIYSEFEAFDYLIFHIHTIFSLQFIWEVF